MGRSPIGKRPANSDVKALSPLPPKRKAIDDLGSSDLFALCALAQMAGARRSSIKGDVSDEDISRAVQAFVHLTLRHRRTDAFNGKLLSFLSPQGREDLVGAAIQIKGEWAKADALAKLGAGMEHLSDIARGNIIDAAMGISDEKAKAVALAGLGASIAHLSERQRGGIIDAAIGLRHSGANAVALAALGSR
ncbi:MAG: hypothetical protein QOH33_1412, partial [Paraburkholderia sp.]|nr:hypothetical protein [Paraburkholderia sp.]